MRRTRRRMSRSSRRRSRRRSSHRRSNPGMPVVLVNPSHRGGRRSRRRRSAGKRRRSSRSRVRGHLRRRRNPTVRIGGALLTFGIGLAGGGLAYALDWGVSSATVSPLWQTVIIGAVGAVGSVGLSMLADERLGAGVAGGTGFALLGRVREQIALSKMGESKQNGTTGTSTEALPAGAGAVYKNAAYMKGLRDAAAVYKEAGAVRGMPAKQLAARSYRDTGASRYVEGPIRHYGPQSWVFRPDAGAVYVSAHNR